MKDKFLVYTEEFDMIKWFSDAEIGVLFRALLNFVKTGEKVVLSEKLDVAFMFMSAHIIRDQEKYQSISEKRRAAAKKSVESREGKLSKRKGTEKKTEAKEEAKADPENRIEENYKKENEQVIHEGEKEQVVLEAEKEAARDENLQLTDSMFSANDVALRLKLKKNSTAEEKFEEFYNIYPKKIQKEQAREAFMKINPDIELHKKMILAIEKLKATENWKKEKGRYVPFPARWLDERRWEEEIVLTKEEKIDLDLKNLGMSNMESFDTKEFYLAALKKGMRA